MANETGWFKMKSSSFILTIIGLYGKWWIIAITFVFFIALALGLAIDIRFLIISLMILFLITPMAIAMIFIVYGFRKDCSFNVANHRLHIEGENLEVEIGEDTSEDKDDEEMKIVALCSTVSFPLSSLLNYQVNKNYVIVRLRDKKKGFIYIPLDAFEGDSIKLQKFLKRLFSYATIEG